MSGGIRILTGAGALQGGELEAESSFNEGVYDHLASGPQGAVAVHVKSRAGRSDRSRKAAGQRRFKETAPGMWNVRDVCDWVESVGMGQYRKKFAHHAVDGPLLLKIDEAALKSEIGIVVYGHRSRLAEEIEGLRAGVSGLPGSPKPAAPGAARKDAVRGGALGRLSLEEYRVRLARDLRRATAKASHNRTVAEEAERQAKLSEEEVQRLQAQLSKLEAEIKAMEVRRPRSVDETPWLITGEFASLLGVEATGSGQRGEETFMPKLSKKSLEIMGASGEVFLDRYEQDLRNRALRLQELQNEGLKLVMGEVSDPEAEAKKLIREAQFLSGVFQEKVGVQLLDRKGGVDVQILSEVVSSHQSGLGLSDSEAGAIRSAAFEKRQAVAAAIFHSKKFLERYSASQKTRALKKKEMVQNVLGAEPSTKVRVEKVLAVRHKTVQHFEAMGWALSDLSDNRLDGILKDADTLREEERAQKESDKENLDRGGSAMKAEPSSPRRLSKMLSGGSGDRDEGSSSQLYQETVYYLAKARKDSAWEKIIRTEGKQDGVPKKAIAIFREYLTQRFLESTQEDLRKREVKLDSRLASRMETKGNPKKGELGIPVVSKQGAVSQAASPRRPQSAQPRVAQSTTGASRRPYPPQEGFKSSQAAPASRRPIRQSSFPKTERREPSPPKTRPVSELSPRRTLGRS